MLDFDATDAPVHGHQQGRYVVRGKTSLGTGGLRGRRPSPDWPDLRFASRRGSVTAPFNYIGFRVARTL